MQDQTPLFEENLRPASLHSARLMDPDEVLSSLAGRSREAEQVRGRWFLCGDVSDRFYDLAKGRHDIISFRVSAFLSPDQLPYSLISHQLEESQHRFVLPLYEARVAKCLRHALAEPLAFSLGHDSSNEAVIQMPPTIAPALAPLLALHLPLTREAALLAVEDFPKVLAAACEPGQVPSLLGGREVRDVSVSALFPEEAIAMVIRGNPR
jgi:hypothetical protein